MKASQYLYTSWKNAPNHGFSVYSTSPDVTREESTHIALIMKYRAPSNLPYEPTDEEIATLFPRNTAYFRLPTGRYCIAMSSYVGHEYKGFEDAGRMGNYLTHAYIFDEPQEFYPASFIDSGYFRRDLTTEEWRASNPAPLPVVELPVKDKGADVSAFVKGREETLKKLVQAVMDGAGADKSIYLNDAYENMKFWYMALSLCLPKSVNAKLTFNTFSFDDINANFKVPPTCRLNVLNLTPGGFSPINWQQKSSMGNIVFDMKSNTVSAPAAGAYAVNIVEELSADPARAVKTVEEIGRLCNAVQCTPDAAFEVAHLEAALYDGFATVERLAEIYAVAKKDPTFNEQAFADSVCPVLLQRGGNAALELIGRLYPIFNAENKRAVVETCAKGYLANGSGDPRQYSERFKSSLPFPYKDFTLLYYGQDHGEDYFENYKTDLSKIYLLADAALTCEADLERAYGADTVKLYYEKLVAYYTQKNERQFVKLLFDRASANGFAVRLVGVAIAALEKTAAPKVPLDWYLDLVSMELSRPEKAEEDLVKLITTYPVRDELIAVYDGFSDSIRAIDARLRANPACADFFTELEKVRLTKKDMGIPELTKYYAEYYLTKKDRDGILLKQTDGYFTRRVNDNDRPYKAVEFYGSLSAVKPPEGELLERVYRYGYEKVPMDRLEKLISEPRFSKDYCELADVLYKKGLDMTSFAVAFCAAGYTQASYEKLIEAAKKDSIYASMQGKEKLLFFKYYGDRAVSFAVFCEKKKKVSGKEVYEKVFLPLIVSDSFSADFPHAFDSLKKYEDLIGTLCHMILVAATVSGEREKALGKGLQGYFDTLKGKETKKLFEYALQYAGEKNEKAVQKFIDAYNATAKKGGFFSKIFGK